MTFRGEIDRKAQDTTLMPILRVMRALVTLFSEEQRFALAVQFVVSGITLTFRMALNTHLALGTYLLIFRD